LQGYLQADPDNYPLLCEAGDLCLQLGEMEQARPLLEKALAMQPADLGAVYRMAVLLYHDKEWNDSLALTQKILDAGQRHSVVRYQHALTLVRLGKFAEAEPFLAELLQERAALPELPYLYIRTLHYLAKLEEATAFAHAHLQQHPDDVVARGMLSLLYLDQEKVADAEKVAQQVLHVAPNNLDALLAAGSAALGLEHEEDAQGLFERAIAVSPTNGRAWLGLGLGGMMTGHYAQAEEQLVKAVECMPEHLGSWNTLAWLQISQRNLNAAERTLNKCLEINRNFGETHGSLAVVAAMRGEWDKAKILTEKALRLQPDSFAGRFAESLLMAQRGHPQQAGAMVDTILDNFKTPGGDTMTEFMRSFMSRRQGNGSNTKQQ
jgi:tetratricopeptide (TPR) repeat protein